MSKILFEPGSPTFNELIGNRKVFSVPKYQRDYSWDYEEWDDLWNDIVGIEKEGVHYMGYVVLQHGETSRNLIIIDGQQRIATLSILILSIIKLLEEWVEVKCEPEPNKKRVELIKNQFIGFTSPSSLTLVSKLKLNRNNDSFYQSYLLRLRKPVSISGLKPSERKMWKAFVFFLEKLKGKFDKSKNGAEVSDFLEQSIADKLVFTSITVGDELNAYKVFETLNARGVKLSTGDLIKNYLFSEVAKTSEFDLDEAERQWQKINDLLQKNDLPVFLRHYWNSTNPLETKASLFKAIKNKISGRDSVFNFLDELEEITPVYIALSEAGNEIWSKEQRKYIEELSLFGVVQCFTLLMAAYKKIKSKDEQEFNKILRDITIIVFRYNTISNLNANLMEKAFNKTALAISEGKLKTSRDVFESLKNEVYLKDQLFEQNFAYKSVNTNKSKVLARYILCKIESQLSGIAVDWNNSKVSIEHILPENFAPEWDDVFDSEQKNEYTYRIGNLTLLETGKNKQCGNKNFQLKKKIYETSVYHMTKSETAYTEWNPVIIQKRQDKLAKYAKSVWRVQY